MSDLTFLEQFAEKYAWRQAPAKRRFRFRKRVNRGMEEEHRLALTLGGVIDRALDDDEGLQSSDYSTYQIFEADDLVFKLIDLENIRTSRVGYVPRRGIMSPAYIRLEPASKQSNSRFYYWFFYGAYINNIFNGMGGGVRQNLTPTDLLEFPIPLPDLDTQKAIADFLDRETARIDQLIEKKRHFLSLLNNKRAAVISQVVTKGLDAAEPVKASGVDWIGTIPSSWTMMKLGYLGTCTNGINIEGAAFGSGFPFISYGDVYKNRELPLNVSSLVQSSDADRSRYSVRTGDVLFTRTSETVEEIGFPSVCLQSIEDAVFAGFLIRFRPRSRTLEPRFSKFAFQNTIFRDFFSKEMMLVTRASLSQSLLKKMPVPVPPLEEQRKIADFLEKADSKIASTVSKTERSISLLTELRAALITAAVTGQIDVATWGRKGQTDRCVEQIEK